MPVSRAPHEDLCVHRDCEHVRRRGLWNVARTPDPNFDGELWCCGCRRWLPADEFVGVMELFPSPGEQSVLL